MANREPAPFGALLFVHRTSARLTQEQLAARAGLSTQAIAALERGKRRAPRAVTVELLATALELDEHDRAQFVAAAQDTVHAGTPEGANRPRRAGRDLGRRRWPAGEPTPLVDRVQELDAIVRLLTVERVRLLTLTGPAGVGKTRVALAAATHLAADRADRFPDGITLVDLTPVHDPVVVLSTIARALGFLEFGSRPVFDRLIEALAEGQHLVVLDNVEQVLPAATQLADLLAACPGLVFLVTSRVPLRLRWERILRVSPLPVPDPTAPVLPLEELTAIPSIALFVQQARARQADFVLREQQAPVVARLAAQLDGLPLALELAAARTATLSLSTIAHRLGDRLRLLRWDAVDVPARQRSLEAAVGWSYDLLSPGEQRLFRCLGVFVGRVALDAITAVATAVARDVAGGTTAVGGAGGTGAEARGEDGGRTLDQLASLAEQSLLLPLRTAHLGWQQGGTGGIGNAEEANAEHDEEAEPAFGMLETVRTYAEERLAAAGELEVARRAHALYFLGLAERADRELRSRDQRVWFLRLEREHDNLRAALRWLLDRDGAAERERALRLAGALGHFWYERGYPVEGERWLEEALQRAPEAEAGVRIRALIRASMVQRLIGKLDQAKGVLEDARALAEQRGDRSGLAEAIMQLGTVAIYGGDFAAGLPLLEEALAQWRELGDGFQIATILATLGGVAEMGGEYERATTLYPEALDQFQAIGNLHYYNLVNFGFSSSIRMVGDYRRAVALMKASLQLTLRFRERRSLTHAAEGALWLAEERTDPERRMRLLGAVDTLTEATGPTLRVFQPGVEQCLAALRERIEPEGWGAAYRVGRSLSVAAMAVLIGEVLEDVARTLEQGPQLGGGQELEQRQPTLPPMRSPLSAREAEVLRLVAEGHSTKTICQRLFLSPSTVNQHVKAIFNKLGVDTRAQAVAVAAQRGLL